MPNTGESSWPVSFPAYAKVSVAGRHARQIQRIVQFKGDARNRVQRNESHLGGGIERLRHGIDARLDGDGLDIDAGARLLALLRESRHGREGTPPEEPSCLHWLIPSALIPFSAKICPMQSAALSIG